MDGKPCYLIMDGKPAQALAWSRVGGDVKILVRIKRTLYVRQLRHIAESEPRNNACISPPALLYKNLPKIQGARMKSQEEKK